MKGIAILAASIAALFVANSAQAITVDGVLDSDYGQAKSSVGYDPAAPTSNFGTPTGFSNALPYDIYLKEQGGTVFGFLQVTGTGGDTIGSLANLYFGPSNGSTIGFEINNQRAFTPGVSGYVEAPLLAFVPTATGLEFSIPDAYFTGGLDGLGATGLSAGSQVYLRLSQAFGYSVAGGAATYGSERLGSVTLSATAVPGPIAGAGLIPLAGLGAAWFARRRKQRAAA